MRKIARTMMICLLCVLLINASAQAKESYEYIDPFFYPKGILAMYYGFSENEYMDYVNNLDESYGRVGNTCGEIKGYKIGRMASFIIDWNDSKLSDRQLANILLNEVWDVDDESQEQINSILANIDSARVWLMGSEVYGWGLQYDIPAIGEEFYLFRVETQDQTTAFVITCQYECDGGESVSFKLLEEN